jgi:cyclic pyranopterin phosphate synthase
LFDNHNRYIHKLRVSVTHACNLTCRYCKPDKVPQYAGKDLLSSEEIITICSNLVNHGIDEIRLTGGEPTLRKGLTTIVSGLSRLPLSKLGITTNGTNIDHLLPFLSQTKCQHINFSLDSLNEKTFFNITGSNSFQKVFKSIIKSKEMGFQVKINVVPLRGLNDNEILNFIAFSSQCDIEVRFLELMKVGHCKSMHQSSFISAKEIKERISREYTLTPLESRPGSTSVSYTTESGARIGFIASETQPFCETCSRLRLTAEGELRPCLMSTFGINLRDTSLKDYPNVLETVLCGKPLKRGACIEEPLFMVGG